VCRGSNKSHWPIHPALRFSAVVRTAVTSAAHAQQRNEGRKGFEARSNNTRELLLFQFIRRSGYRLLITVYDWLLD